MSTAEQYHSWHDWLMGQKNRMNNLGDVARKIGADRKFPATAAPDVQFEYVRRRYSIPMKEAFKRAWRSYLSDCFEEVKITSGDGMKRI